MRISVIDSNFLCYRALHTTGGLSYRNKRTGIVYGFLNQLLTIAKETQPDALVFAWDSRQSKRRDICPEYKNRRQRQLDPLEIQDMNENYAQFTALRKEIIPSLGFEDGFKFRGLEADDVIASLVYDKRYKEHEFIVVTGDDDLLQLLDFCKIFHPGKHEWKDRDWFLKEYGIVPKQWIRVKQMAGCVSDNVKGITGVGEKKALQYIRGKMKPTTKIYQRIEEPQSQFIINQNRELVRLPFHGTPAVDISGKKSSINMRALRRICKELGIRTLISPSKEDDWEVHLHGK